MALARRRRRRERIGALVVAGGALIVIALLLAIPVVLITIVSGGPALPDGFAGRLGVLLAGSLKAAIGALVVAIPLGLATAIHAAHFASPRLRDWMKPAFELMEAIPTVVLGLVAAVTLAPWLKSHVATVLALIVAIPATLIAVGAWAGARRAPRQGWLAIRLVPLVVAVAAVTIAATSLASKPAIAVSDPWNAMLIGLALGFAAIPLVFSLAEEALAGVPPSQMRAALALGATRWQALRSVVLPAAGAGLVAAIVLGVSRCIGETMIVLMASGNTPIADANPLTGLRTLSAELALGLPEASPSGSPYRALLLAALVLFALTFVLNSLGERLRAALRRRAAFEAEP